MEPSSAHTLIADILARENCEVLISGEYTSYLRTFVYVRAHKIDPVQVADGAFDGVFPSAKEIGGVFFLAQPRTKWRLSVRTEPLLPVRGT